MTYDNLYNSIVRYQRKYAPPVKGYSKEVARRANYGLFTDLRNAYLANKLGRDNQMKQMSSEVYSAMYNEGSTRGTWAGEALVKNAKPIQQAYNTAQQQLASSLENWKNQRRTGGGSKPKVDDDDGSDKPTVPLPPTKPTDPGEYALNNPSARAAYENACKQWKIAYDAWAKQYEKAWIDLHH